MGQLIRRVREGKLPMPTQTELAFCIEQKHGIKLSQGWVSKVELGRIKNPGERRVRALAEELDIDERELFARLYDIPYDGYLPAPSPPSLPDDLSDLFDFQVAVEAKIRKLMRQQLDAREQM